MLESSLATVYFDERNPEVLKTICVSLKYSVYSLTFTPHSHQILGDHCKQNSERETGFSDFTKNNWRIYSNILTRNQMLFISQRHFYLNKSELVMDQTHVLIVSHRGSLTEKLSTPSTRPSASWAQWTMCCCFWSYSCFLMMYWPR